MWVLRRATGRRLWQREWDDDLPPEVQFDPNASDATRAALGAIAAANAADPTAGRASEVPTPTVTMRRGTRPILANTTRTIVASPTPVRDLRRRAQAHRKRTGLMSRRRAVLGSLAIVLFVAVAAVGASLLPWGQQGQALGSAGQARITPAALASQVAALPSRASESPTPSPTLTEELASPSFEPSASPVVTPGPTARPTPRLTPRPTARPTATPAPTPAPTPTSKPSPTPTAKPKPTSTPTLPPAVAFSWVVSGKIVTFTNHSTGTGLTTCGTSVTGGPQSRKTRFMAIRAPVRTS